MRRLTALICLVLSLGHTMASAASVEGVVVVLSDQHSAYERTAQLLGHVDRLKSAHPGVPMAICINGDSLELGNAVARRTSGQIDFAMFSALARRAPTIINLGNHEPEFYDVPETIRRLCATGVTVISGNLRARASGKPYAPPTAELRLGNHDITVVGVTTDALATYRVAIRPDLDLADPAVWARNHFPDLLKPGRLPIVLSHAGLRADRKILEIVPDSTLFAGGHDHLRFVHHAGRTVYFHSGSWMEFASVARLRRTNGKLAWDLEQFRIEPTDPGDQEMEKLIRETLAEHLTAEEKEVVGRTPKSLSPTEAALFSVEAARVAAGADAAVIGATTFGAGLPQGDVTRYAFDACVRFDGPLWVAEVDGEHLMRILARANHGPETPFVDRAGENLVAVSAGSLQPTQKYRLVTTDWIAKNAEKYLGSNPPTLTERKGSALKAAVIAALKK